MQKRKKRIVLIGGGAAAIGAVEGIRRVDKGCEIVLVAKEAHRTYARPLISYYLQGKTDLARMEYRSASFYEENAVRALWGVGCESIDAQKKRVKLDNGVAMEYDALLYACGSVPFLPPMEGIEKVERRTGFMTLDDALHLETMLGEGKDKRVLIIGAGLIGMKCAEGIAEKAAAVTVVEMAPRVLPAILDGECAAIIQTEMEKHGVAFRLGDSVARFEENKALLKSGESVDFDVLVTAVGVRPNIALYQQAGGSADRAIRTDERMQTALSGVYAAGDCVLSRDSTDSNADKVLALMPNAYMQGYTAGQNMAGGAAKFITAFPMNAGGFFGLHLITAGSTRGECLTLPNEGGVKKLYVRDNVLVGFLLLGNVERAGIYTALIRDRVPLSDIDFDLVAADPRLIAFSRGERKKMLGGEKA